MLHEAEEGKIEVTAIDPMGIHAGRAEYQTASAGRTGAGKTPQCYCQPLVPD